MKYLVEILSDVNSRLFFPKSKFDFSILDIYFVHFYFLEMTFGEKICKNYT